MLKYPVKYKNIDGTLVEETLHFNYTKAELFELEAVHDGLGKYLRSVMDSGDRRLIMQTFKDFIGGSYGERDQHNRFVKNESIQQAFLCSEAYSELLEQLMRAGENGLAAFMKGLMPDVDLGAAAKQTVELPPTSLEPDLPKLSFNNPTPSPERTVSITPMTGDVPITNVSPLGVKAELYTREELLNMPQERLIELLNRQPK